MWSRDDSNDDYPEDFGEEVINYHTSLMLATFRNDLNMMRFLLDNGVEANFCQPVWEEDLGERGGFNALWVATSTEAIQLLLSRGADPTQECKLEKQGGSTHDAREICPQPLLLHQIQFDKVLIKYGANPNAYHIDYGDYSEGMPPFVSDAYWPKQLAREPLDLKWCEELLTEHGANPNWPVGAEGGKYENILLKNKIVAFETLNERFKTLPEGEEKESIDQELDAADEAIQEMEEDAEPSIKEPQGLTVLMKAVLTGNIAVVQLLLKHNADPNQFDPTDRKEWEEMAECCDTDFCVYYSHDGTVVNDDTEYDDWEMQSPLSIALKQGNQEMIGLLKSHGATK
tara:strand:+ start:850 stop:1878 length:1029 start_codon:yes stop_codon:yes gene_type:complete